MTHEPDHLPLSELVGRIMTEIQMEDAGMPSAHPSVADAAPMESSPAFPGNITPVQDSADI